MSEQCSKIIYGGSTAWGGSQCSKRGKVKVNDKWFCGIHSPEADARRKARRDANYAAYKADIERRNLHSKRREACVNAFHDPAGRKIATEDIGERLVWQLIDHLERTQDKLEMFIEDHEDPGADAFAVTHCNRALLSSLKIQEPENG